LTWVGALCDQFWKHGRWDLCTPSPLTSGNTHPLAIWYTSPPYVHGHGINSGTTWPTNHLKEPVCPLAQASPGVNA